MGCRICLIASFLAVAVSPLVAEESLEPASQAIVVTATRVETPIENVGSAITVLSSEDLERAQIRDVSDALRLVPGVTVAQNGGPGRRTAAFVRGAPAGFTRVMIDGVEVNDPSGIGTAFDFAHLNATGIERIEVLRGPQSTLYGSDAMAGVINIITRKGSGDPSSYLSAEYGSFETWRVGAGTAGSTNRAHYAFDFGYHRTDGFSAFDEKDGFTERDGYENYTLSGRVGVDLSEILSLDAILRFTKGDADYDSFDAFFTPGEDGRIETEQALARIEGRASLLDGMWDQVLGVSKTAQQRDFVGTPGVEDSSFDSDILAVDWQNNIFLDSHTLTVGIDGQEDEADTTSNPKADYRTVGYFLQDTITPADPLDITLGARVDDHSEFGSETTYRGVVSYDVESVGARVKASWGNGYKAPSLFQLFASDAFVEGNPDLGPQKSEGWDVGVEQGLFEDALRVGVTYFEIAYEDLIDFVSSFDGTPGTYRNVDEAESTGVEAFVAARPSDDVELRVDYTYLDNTDKSEGTTFELRRPEHQVSGMLTYQATDTLELALSGVHVGERSDFGDVHLGSYTLVNLAASYDLTESLECYGRVENLLDEEYQQISTYGTAGIAGYVGFRARF